MQKDYVSKLADFGFTTNQAKVYLSIIQSGKTNVGQISKNTLLHRQDIYKLLPKLEKMGLITLTIGKPVMIEALPVEEAIRRLIAKEKQVADRRIKQLEQTIEELAQEIMLQPKTTEDTRFTLLTTSAALKNRVDETFKAKRISFKLVSTTENLKGQAGHFYKQYFQMLADNGIKTHLILVGAENPTDLKKLVEKIAPRNGYLTAKAMERCASKDYQVIDNSEVWIATQQKTPEGYPAILWTNDVNMVESYLENFREAWSNPKAVPLLECPDRQIETIKAVST
jgi:sugar-specific transcriptional regulator TrmB